MKLVLSLLLIFLLAQANTIPARKFDVEIRKGDFKKVDFKKLPKPIQKKYNCNSRREIGNKKLQTGCTSGKRVVVNWLVKNEFDIWVASVNSCGAWTSNTNYLVKDGVAYELELNKEYGSFESLKKEYLK